MLTHIEFHYTFEGATGNSCISLARAAWFRQRIRNRGGIIISESPMTAAEARRRAGITEH